MTAKVRIDKWLWAARFFKTRSLAKTAIEGGKVQINDQRTKPGREVSVGLTLTVRQGWDEKTVVVEALSEQRRSAPEAALLYTETCESITRREQHKANRKAYHGGLQQTDHRPNKKQRRQIHRFRELNHDERE